MKLLALIWLTLSTGVTEPIRGGSELHSSSDSGAVRACPPEQPTASGRISTFFASEVLPMIREHLDLGTASAEDVRLLRNPADREVCGHLWEALAASGDALAPTDSVTFYRSGNMYFAPVSRRPPLPPGVVMRLDGTSALLVYDSEFRLVGRFGV